MLKYKERRCFEFDNRVEEFFDAREGVLLDSYIGVTTYGALVCVLVTYVSPWASCYTVYESETEEEDGEVWNIWNNFTDEYDAEYPPEE